MENSNDLPSTVYLKKEFRIKLFCKAYEKTGSLVSLGVSLGYRSRKGLNGVARDMWLGRSGIPKYRIDQLLKLTQVSLEELSKNLVSREQSEEVDNWMGLYENYKKRTR